MAAGEQPKTACLGYRPIISGLPRQPQPQKSEISYLISSCAAREPRRRGDGRQLLAASLFRPYPEGEHISACLTRTTMNRREQRQQSPFSVFCVISCSRRPTHLEAAVAVEDGSYSCQDAVLIARRPEGSTTVETGPHFAKARSRCEIPAHRTAQWTHFSYLVLFRHEQSPEVMSESPDWI
jgi:hypothetical protein